MTKVRYKPSLAIGIFLLGGLLALSMSSGVLAGLTILEASVIALAFYSRPYLIIENNRAAFVSLISNNIKKEITAEEMEVGATAFPCNGTWPSRLCRVAGVPSTRDLQRSG